MLSPQKVSYKRISRIFQKGVLAYNNLRKGYVFKRAKILKRKGNIFVCTKIHGNWKDIQARIFRKGYYKHIQKYSMKIIEW